MVEPKKRFSVLNYSCELDSRISHRIYWVKNYKESSSQVLAPSLISTALNIPMSKLSYQNSPNSKPKAFSEGFEIYFNVSHSAKLFGLCLAKTAVGLDIEILRPVLQATKLAKRFFSEPESEHIQKTSANTRSLEFLKLWTRKEAVIKAAGVGIAPHLNLEVCADRISFQNRIWKLETHLSEDKIYSVAQQIKLPLERPSSR